MPKVRLRIRGMTCASCVHRVEKSLTRVSGVKEALVNLATEEAEVVLTEPIPPEALVEAVEKAGYTAELETPESTASESPYTLQRFLISAGLTLPVLVLSMLLPNLWRYQGWLLWALTTLVQFWVAFPLYRVALSALRAGSANMEVLVLLGTLSAYGYSTILLLSGHPQHLYFEASAVILTLVLLGRYLEARAIGSARSAMESLYRLLPSNVLRWDGAVYNPVPLSAVQVGDRLMVCAGERIPVDGVVLMGSGWVDESTLTGESVPRERQAGDPVRSGSLLTDGVLHIRAEAVGEATMLAQIARAVQQAQTEKAQIQRLADRVASIFVPLVVGIALLTFVGWWLSTRSVAQALVPAVSVLVIACPCALGLAVPIALMTGSTRMARAGILLKGVQALERVRQIDVLVLDKTGTLTMGHPRVKAMHISHPDIDERAALRFACALEQSTRHPLAEAILQYAHQQGVQDIPELKTVRTVPSGGVEAEWEGHLLRIGSARFLWESGIEQQNLPEGTVFLAADQTVVAGFEFTETPLPNVSEVIRRIQQSGIEVVLCSGDRLEAVERFARMVGIHHWYGRQLPSDKAHLIKRYQSEGHKVAFVGDGINDAPALAQADLSIAVATGTQIAIDTADMVLLNHDLKTLESALQLARALYAIIRQNLFFAFVYNTVGIPLASLGYLNPIIAGLAMSMSSVSVVGNALRLLRWRA